MRLWRNWYTRSVEVAVGFILWKFKSSQPHQIHFFKINDPSPIGIKQINQLNNVKLEQVFWDKLEAKYKIV